MSPSRVVGVRDAELADRRLGVGEVIVSGDASAAERWLIGSLRCEAEPTVQGRLGGVVPLVEIFSAEERGRPCFVVSVRDEWPAVWFAEPVATRGWTTSMTQIEIERAVFSRKWCAPLEFTPTGGEGLGLRGQGKAAFYRSTTGRGLVVVEDLASARWTLLGDRIEAPLRLGRVEAP